MLRLHSKWYVRIGGTWTECRDPKLGVQMIEALKRLRKEAIYA
jgi:hypothetical protein